MSLYLSGLTKFKFKYYPYTGMLQIKKTQVSNGWSDNDWKWACWWERKEILESEQFKQTLIKIGISLSEQIIEKLS